MDFALKGDWPGRFGFVKFKLHAGFFNGDKAYFIRTDASDKAYAEANNLVFVPLLGGVPSVPGVASKLYLFEGGSPDQLPVLSTAPSQENYSPLWQLHKVTPKGNTPYDSEEKLKAAESSGDVTIEAQSLFVNYPVVKWPGGELSVDKDKKEYLGTGQLLEPVIRPADGRSNCTSLPRQPLHRHRHLRRAHGADDVRGRRRAGAETLEE
jgi:hypothetical protein